MTQDVNLVSSFPAQYRDNVGRLMVTQDQNVFEADFEYGLQPMRWEAKTYGAGTIVSTPGIGGVQMNITSAAGDITIRQSRLYFRYLPGKTLFMASAINFGTANTGQRQRVGFFDDGNGIFIEQGDPTPTNPYGMFCSYRSDINGVPTDVRTSYENWTNPPTPAYPSGPASSINWNNLQMIWIEFAWYGAGLLRWGIYIKGEPLVLHTFGVGNAATVPWARTGNLPVRYEQRNISASVANTMYHWGVSVLVRGLQDDQRGFTYPYGMLNSAPTRSVANATNRFPVVSFRARVMGTQEYTQAGAAITGTPTTTGMTVAGTPWTTNQWVGRYVFFPGTGAQGIGAIGRITANTTNTLTYADNITGLPISTAPIAGANYQIGLINRGQILPRTLLIYCTAVAYVELIVSTATAPLGLTGASFVALNTLTSNNSLAERDVSATAIASGGEVVFGFPAPAGGSGLQQIDLTNLFALANNVQGNQPDILTVAISNNSGAAATVGATMIGQEKMS